MKLKKWVLTAYMTVKPKHLIHSFYTYSAFILVGCLCSCSATLPIKGVQDYYNCSYDQAYETFVNKSQKAKAKDKAIYDFAALSSAFRAGRYEDVVRIGSLLIDYSWSNIGHKKGIASLLSAESLKYYKGEPFEKAMVSIYTGVALYQLGQYDNARASLAKANLAIENKYKKGGESDFGLSLYLLAMMYVQQNELDNAKILLKRAEKRFPDNAYLNMKRLQGDNVFVVVEDGVVPKKVESGPGGSLVAWQPAGYYQVKSPKINLLNTNQEFFAHELGDLHYQAISKENKGTKTVQAVKGFLREAAIITTAVALDSNSYNRARGSKKNKTTELVALSAGLFALANQSQADTRQWELLPEKFYVASFRLKPGQHNIRVKTHHEQTFSVTIENEKQAKILFVNAKTCKPRSYQ